MGTADLKDQCVKKVISICDLKIDPQTTVLLLKMSLSNLIYRTNGRSNVESCNISTGVVRFLSLTMNPPCWRRSPGSRSGHVLMGEFLCQGTQSASR